MASGKSIGILLIGIAIIVVGIFLVIFWVRIAPNISLYNDQALLCDLSPDPANCLVLLQQEYGGDLALLDKVYLYGGFGCIAGGAICLILALKKLMKGN